MVDVPAICSDVWRPAVRCHRFLRFVHRQNLRFFFVWRILRYCVEGRRRLRHSCRVIGDAFMWATKIVAVLSSKLLVLVFVREQQTRDGLWTGGFLALARRGGGFPWCRRWRCRGAWAVGRPGEGRTLQGAGAGSTVLRGADLLGCERPCDPAAAAPAVRRKCLRFSSSTESSLCSCSTETDTHSANCAEDR